MTDFFIKMKKQLYIFCLLLIGFGLITYGCGLITMIVYGQIIKPTETWYFSKGYDKKIISSNIKTEISDSSNISFRSLRLVRKDNDTIKSYWIDFDTSIHNENLVRIKIVDEKGYILRFLDGWLVPEPENKIDYNSISFNEDSKGNIRVKLGDSEHSIYHAGDMMGMHHFDINSPKIIKQRPSFQMNWGGYNFEYSWITFEGIKDDFNCSIERAFKAPILGDARRFMKGYLFQPAVTAFEEDETWGQVNGVRYPVTGGNLLVKKGRLFKDEILERKENELWKWTIYDFKIRSVFLLIKQLANGMWKNQIKIK